MFGRKKKGVKPKKDQVALPLGPLDDLADPKALKEADDIIKRSYEGTINIDESLRLLVTAMINHSVDPDEALRAVHRAVKKFVQTTQYSMLVQAIKHISDDVRFSNQLDTLGQEVLVKIVSGEEKMVVVEKDKKTGKERMVVCTIPPKDRIAAYRELRAWRKDKLDYAMEVLKIFYELERLEKFIHTMDELVEAGIAGSSVLKDKIKELAPEDRRDVSILIRWIMKSRDIDVEGMIVALEKDGSGHPS